MVETMQIRPIEFFSTHPAPENRISYLTQKTQTPYYNISRLKIGQEDYSTGMLKQLND
jgi:predicted Zn-dependent protease